MVRSGGTGDIEYLFGYCLTNMCILAARLVRAYKYKRTQLRPVPQRVLKPRSRQQINRKEPRMPATTSQVQIRRGDERGQTEIGWLHSRHSFSFGHYYDPKNMGYRSLRVINDDVVEPRSGFGEHGHDNMEIITW